MSISSCKSQATDQSPQLQPKSALISDHHVTVNVTSSQKITKDGNSRLSSNNLNRGSNLNVRHTLTSEDPSHVNNAITIQYLSSMLLPDCGTLKNSEAT